MTKKFMKTSKKAIIKGFTEARGRAPSAEEIAYYKKLHKETNIKWKEKPKMKRVSSATKKKKSGISNKKVYNKKIFKRHGKGVIATKSGAEEIRKGLKEKGYNARKQYRKRQNAWIVWIKKKKIKKKKRVSKTFPKNPTGLYKAKGFWELKRRNGQKPSLSVRKKEYAVNYTSR